MLMRIAILAVLFVSCAGGCVSKKPSASEPAVNPFSPHASDGNSPTDRSIREMTGDWRWQDATGDRHWQDASSYDKDTNSY
jgi:hypothetical protein